MTYSQAYRAAYKALSGLDPCARDETAHDAAVAALLAGKRLEFARTVARRAAWRLVRDRENAGRWPRTAIPFSVLGVAV